MIVGEKAEKHTKKRQKFAFSHALCYIIIARNRAF